MEDILVSEEKLVKLSQTVLLTVYLTLILTMNTFFIFSFISLSLQQYASYKFICFISNYILYILYK